MVDTKQLKQFSIASLKTSLTILREWRLANDSQSATHLTHVLAVKHAGAKPNLPIPYTEQSVDFAFCDKFLRVNNSKLPYFDPLDASHRIRSHPHSNVATARKKTFSDKWGAGRFIESPDQTSFELIEGYEQIWLKKLRKQGVYTPLNAVALSQWIYREKSWEGDITLKDVVAAFREEFNFSDDEWSALFLEKSSNEDEPGTWAKAKPQLENQVMLDVLTNDSEEFDIFFALHAIKEVTKMSLVSAEMILGTLETLKTKQLVLQGPPGTGKTHLAMNLLHSLVGENYRTKQSSLDGRMSGNWGMLQLHPSYAYEDFIEKSKPTVEKDGRVSISVEEMPFLIACKEAQKISPEPFVLILDEMNRADLQRLFGELMFALEYRDQAINLQYSRKKLVVPSNLILIGTMNTADSSVIQLDYAIRRRFVFFDVQPDRHVIMSEVEETVVRNAALRLFDATLIACDHHPRFSIGHSFYLHQSLDALLNSFVFQVLPIIRAYQENGVISSDTVITPNEWESEPISARQTRPDVLLEALEAWANNLNESH